MTDLLDNLSDFEVQVLSMFVGHGDVPGDQPYAEEIFARVMAHRRSRGQDTVEIPDVVAALEGLASRNPPLLERRGKEEATFPFERYAITRDGLLELGH